MRAFILQYLYRIRSSYWFIPSLMAIGAFILSTLLIILDTTIGSTWIDDFSWLYANKPEGARAVLSTIAGSMITVAGVTFSITIVSVTNAAGRFGPRILTNFMGDRGNQVTLGVFIATFIYCLLVLRTVRSADSPGWQVLMPGGNQSDGGFVPHLSVIVGILLALASIGVLIFFIHHVPESIHISNVAGRIGNDLKDRMEKLYPPAEEGEKIRAEKMKPGKDYEGEIEGDVATMIERIRKEGYGVQIGRSGYLEQVDNQGMMIYAKENDLTIVVMHPPGQFVYDPTVVMRIWPPKKPDDELLQRLRHSFIVGVQRTPAQDVMFLVDELIEIAVIALSPGINDPFTAMTCLGWLGAALARPETKGGTLPCRYDEKGNLRLVLPVTPYSQLVAHIFTRLRPHISSEPNVAIRTMEMFEELAEITRGEGASCGPFHHEADALLKVCSTSWDENEHFHRLEELYRRKLAGELEMEQNSME